MPPNMRPNAAALSEGAFEKSQHKVDGIIAMALRRPVRFEKQKQGTWRKTGIMPCVWMNKSKGKERKLFKGS